MPPAGGSGMYLQEGTLRVTPIVHRFGAAAVTSQRLQLTLARAAVVSEGDLHTAGTSPSSGGVEIMNL